MWLNMLIENYFQNRIARLRFENGDSFSSEDNISTVTETDDTSSQASVDHSHAAVDVGPQLATLRFYQCWSSRLLKALFLVTLLAILILIMALLVKLQAAAFLPVFWVHMIAGAASLSLPALIVLLVLSVLLNVSVLRADCSFSLGAWQVRNPSLWSGDEPVIKSWMEPFKQFFHVLFMAWTRFSMLRQFNDAVKQQQQYNLAAEPTKENEIKRAFPRYRQLTELGYSISKAKKLVIARCVLNVFQVVLLMLVAMFEFIVKLLQSIDVWLQRKFLSGRRDQSNSNHIQLSPSRLCRIVVWLITIPFALCIYPLWLLSDGFDMTAGALIEKVAHVIIDVDIRSLIERQSSDEHTEVMDGDCLVSSAVTYSGTNTNKQHVSSLLDDTVVVSEDPNVVDDLDVSDGSDCSV